RGGLPVSFGLVAGGLGFLTQTRLLFLSRNGDLPGFLLPEEGPCRNAQSDNQRGCHTGRGSEGELVPSNQFLESVEIVGWPRHNRFAAEVTLDVRRQAIGGLVTPLAVLFQA